MNKWAVFLILALGSSGCQVASERASSQSGEGQAFQDPAVAASVASDLSGDISPLIPKGSVLAFRAGATQPLSGAFGEALTQLGYRMQDSGASTGEAILLDVWSAEVDGDLLVRVSSPSHHLSKVYRQSSSSLGQTGDPAATGGVMPAGPLLVETTSKGAAT